MKLKSRGSIKTQLGKEAKETREHYPTNGVPGRLIADVDPVNQAFAVSWRWR